MSGLSDEALAARAAAGDPRAFEELVHRHHARLRKRLCARLFVQVRRCWPVADTLQEVWLAAWRSLHRFQPNGPGSFRRWLNGIVRFKELSILRSYYRHPPPPSHERGDE